MSEHPALSKPQDTVNHLVVVRWLAVAKMQPSKAAIIRAFPYLDWAGGWWR